MAIIRHIPFLREVFVYAISAFGGPNAHLGIINKIFVQKRKDITQQELTEYFSFCQILPGPSSTQTITLIAYKRGGLLLALSTLLIWVSPAAILMGALSFAVHYLALNDLHLQIFRFIQPMAIGFLMFASYKAMRISVKHPATYGIMLMAILFTLFLRSPWVFPLLLVTGGVISNISNKRIPNNKTATKKINWSNLWLFIGVFILAGIISEIARVNHWRYATAFNIFENFYRFGSIVFGGGHALIPAMYDQFIALPTQRGLAPMIDTKSFLIGCGFMNCVPGPVFSICTYVGGLAMSSYGWQAQLLGCIVATVGVFLPSILLLLFMFPVYQKLKQHAPIFRALEGIHAVVIGIMWASSIILLTGIEVDYFNAIVVITTISLLQFTKIPPPLIVLGFLLLGWVI
jgi:chromate transporter